MDVAIFPQDFDAPGSYRLVWPLEEMRKRGHRLLIPKFSVRAYRSGWQSIELHTDPDLVADVYVLQMPHEQNSIELLRYWQAKGKVVIVETDDDQLNIPDSHPAAWGTSPDNPETFRSREHLFACARAADLITCSTPSVAESFSELNPNVKVLPNYLYWPWWEDVPQQYELHRERPRIGWMGKSFYRPDDVAVLKDVVHSVLERHDEVDFVAAGDPKLNEHLAIPPERLVKLPPVDFRTRSDMLSSRLPEITASMDIGLVPLARNRFNEGKSCLKGMEYAACGIPCVATPTAPYREWVDSDNGLLADSLEEWTQAIDTLLDPQTRERMGKAARRKVSRYRIDRHWQKWADVYLGEVMKSRARRMPPVGVRAS